VQKYNDNFGKNEEGNEVSFSAFQEMLDKEYASKHSIRTDIYQKIKYLVKIFSLAGKDKLNANERKFSFEIFGCDFLIDNNFDVVLIEVNTNPGLEESSELLKLLVSRMIEDSFRLTIDELFDTKYSDEVLTKAEYFCDGDDNSKRERKYKSPYSLEGYKDDENLW
jgi:hypothetical protein